jgi:hypothetical protein
MAAINAMLCYSGFANAPLHSTRLAGVFAEEVSAKEMPGIIQGIDTLLAKVQRGQYGPTDRKLVALLLLSGSTAMHKLYQSKSGLDQRSAIQYADKLRALVDLAIALDPKVCKESYTTYEPKKEINCIEYVKSLLRKIPSYMG